jgi:methionine-rich copper-binding protein CopC
LPIELRHLRFVVAAAFAHAFLDHAIPGVGMSVSGPVRELRLYYTQGVVTVFSHVHVVSAAGAQIRVRIIFIQVKYPIASCLAPTLLDIVEEPFD